MFQDDLNRLSVGEFFRKHVLFEPARDTGVPRWRQAELEEMVRKAAETIGVPAPKVRVIRTPGIAATHVRITKAGSLFFDTRLVSSAPRTVVAEVVAHEVGHLAQGWRTLVLHVGSTMVVLLAAGTLVWGAAHGYGLVFAWVALAVAVALSASVVAHGRWARRLELDADRTALELVGKDVHLAALTWLEDHKVGSRRPLPLLPARTGPARFDPACGGLEMSRGSEVPGRTRPAGGCSRGRPDSKRQGQGGDRDHLLKGC